MNRLVFGLGVIVLFLATGCSLLKASASKEHVFVPAPELLTENRKRAPFHRYWVYDGKKYFDIRKNIGQVEVVEVDISNVERIYRTSRGSKETKDRRIDEARNLARYLEGKINLLLEDREFSHLISKAEMESKANPKEPLKLRLSLTSVIPTNPGVNFAGSVAGFFVPGGGLIKYFGEGSVAMEGFVEGPFGLDSGQRDIRTLEQYADREGQKTSAFSLKDYQRYAHIRQVLDEWAMQIVELLNTDAQHMVDDSLPVTLNPF